MCVNAVRNGLRDESCPMHVVCKWMRNTPRQAPQRYLQVTDDHIRRLFGKPMEAAQKMHESIGKRPNRSDDEFRSLQPVAETCGFNQLPESNPLHNLGEG